MPGVFLVMVLVTAAMEWDLEYPFPGAYAATGTPRSSGRTRVKHLFSARELSCLAPCRQLAAYGFSDFYLCSRRLW